MEPYLFTGVVLPQRAQLSLQGKFSAEMPSEGEVLEINMSIILNQIIVSVSTEKNFDIYFLRNVIKGFVQTQIASMGVLLGRYYDVQIDRVVSLERNVDYVFEIEIPVIAKRKNYQDANYNFTDAFSKDHQRLMKIMAGESGVFIQRCLNDLTSAMRDASDTGFYCYRALESLMHHCAERFNLKEDKKSDRDRRWQKFREFTSTDKEKIMKIKDFADPLRHGKGLNVTGQEREAIFKETWNIFDRYVEKCSTENDCD